jgi:hypothetical protein
MNGPDRKGVKPTHRGHLDDSHLFLVRVWAGARAEESGWRGKVQHVVSGEAHTFDGWPTLIGLLLEMLPVEEKGVDGSVTRREE